MDGGRKEAAATEVWLHFAIMFHEKQFEDYRFFQRNFAWSTSICSRIGMRLIAKYFHETKCKNIPLLKKGEITVIRNFENAVVLQVKMAKKAQSWSCIL